MKTLISTKRLLADKKQFVFYLGAATLLVFIVLRWFLLIDKYSVNMLYWDQWDFLEALFADKGAWELFTWQHGPHRQGIGFFLTKLVADLSGWNTRAKCFVIGAVVCLAALTALVLKLRITKQFSPLDVFIFLLYLTPLQFGLFANTPNISHGAMPLLLVTLFCLCWTLQHIMLRYVLCAVINFMTIYTGFGFFLGCITPILFLSEIIFSFRKADAKKIALAVFFFFVSVLSFLSFFINYTFTSAAEGFVFPHPHPMMYLQYLLITFANFCGIRGSHIVLYFVGTPVLCFMIYFIVKAGLNLVHHASAASGKNSENKTAVNQIIIVLIAFTLIFALNLAIGRVCLGLETADSSRYQTYLIPAFFALYLFAVTRRNVPCRWIALCMICFFITTFSIGNHNRAYAERLCRGKQKWKQAYLQTEDIYLSDRISGFKIHPNPPHTYLKRKLDYLKEHGLNFYPDASEN